MEQLTANELRKVLSRVWSLGQTYWQQADSDSYRQQDKSEETRQKYLALVEETCAALSSSNEAVPIHQWRTRHGDDVWQDVPKDGFDGIGQSFRRIVYAAPVAPKES